MCYTYLSVLNDILSDGEIAKLKEYFIGLTPNTIALITVSKVANVSMVSCHLVCEYAKRINNCTWATNRTQVR